MAMMQGMPGYFPGMANMVMVPAPSGYADTPYVNGFGDSDSVTSEGSSDWSAEVSSRAPALWFRGISVGLTMRCVFRAPRAHTPMAPFRTQAAAL